METILIRDDLGTPIQALYNLAVPHAKVTVSGASGRNSTAFTHSVVRVTATAAVTIAVGDGTVTATAASHYIPAATPTNVYVGNYKYIAAYGTGDVYFSELGQ